MLLLGALGLQTLRGDWLETGFASLLPKIEARADIVEAIDRQKQLINRKVIWLTGGASAEAAIAHARKLEQQVINSHLFGKVALQIAQDQQVDQFKRLFAYRYQLLDPETH